MPRALKPTAPCASEVLENGPLVASLRIDSDAPGCNQLVREVRVVDGLDRVEFVNHVDRKSVRQKDGGSFRIRLQCSVQGQFAWKRHGRWCDPMWINCRVRAGTGSPSSAGWTFPTRLRDHLGTDRCATDGIRRDDGQPAGKRPFPHVDDQRAWIRKPSTRGPKTIIGTRITRSISPG